MALRNNWVTVGGKNTVVKVAYNIDPTWLGPEVGAAFSGCHVDAAC
jgi:hypothetical protein